MASLQSMIGTSDDFSQEPCTPANEGGRVPPGCVVTSQQWKLSELVKTLQVKLKVIVEDSLGLVDFYPSNDVGVVYISERDLVAGRGYKQKLAKLRKATRLRGMVIAECTPISEQYYNDLQRFAMLELGLRLLFVASQIEAANLLIQMVNEENKPHANPFLIRRCRLVDASILEAVQRIPNIGPVNAKNLLLRFGSIRGIFHASEEELADVITSAKARSVKLFYTYDTSLPRNSLTS